MFDLEEHFTPGTTACFLDDCRTPKPNYYFNWAIVRSYQEFVNYIRQQGVPQFISFDHDLGVSYPEYSKEEEPEAAKLPFIQTSQGRFRSDVLLEPSGMDAAKWLVEWCADNNLLLPLFTAHSANPAGAENILGLLNGYRKFQGQEPNGYRTTW